MGGYILATLLAPPYFHTPFRFTGNAQEYFRIWIVNTLLTILTLGIYSAWAKVRKKRYFYGNTLLNDEPFDYLADPVKILKGRLLVLAIFALIVLIITFYNINIINAYFFFWPFIIPASAVYAWLFVMAMRFRLRNSAYRNIRFNFRGTQIQAAWVIIKSGLVILITLGIGYPYYAYKRRQFVVSKTTYGTTPFTFTATAGDFFFIYFITGLLLFVGPSLLLVVVLTVGAVESVLILIFMPVLMTVYLGALSLAAFAYRSTSIANLVYSNCATERFRLKSDLEFGSMFKLYWTNAIVIILSLGLMIPWAAIRMARYRVEHITLLHHGDLDDFIAGEQERTSAAGEEIAEFFDFDIGL